jgi:hypothetical protein
MVGSSLTSFWKMEIWLMFSRKKGLARAGGQAESQIFPNPLDSEGGREG